MIEIGNPWFFQNWVYGLTVGNPIRKAVLSNLASMADANTGRCEAKQATIAQAVEVSPRSVSGHLKGLEEDGLIARRPQYKRDGSRRGDEFLLLAPGVTEWPDGGPIDTLPLDGGGPAGGSGGSRTRPQGGPEREGGARTPSSNVHASRQAGARASASADAVPDGFPAELRPHAREAMRVLRDAASRQRNAKAVTARALALVIQARPRKPIVAAAYDYAAWLDGKQRRDLVAGYRNWLDGTADLAALEVLPGEAAPPPPGGNVTRLHEHRAASSRDRAAAERERMDAEEAAAIERLTRGGA